MTAVARMQSDACDIAEVIRLAALGWRLFPVKPQEKQPLITGWKAKATDDVRQMREWVRVHPDCNWGLACGPGSRVWVLDVDGEKGRASLAELEAQHGPLPATLASHTGREDGGEHRWFTWPADRDIRNSTGKLGDGLDIRAAGGYAIVPPSIHPTGRRYQWANPEVPIADAPPWLLEMLTTPAERPAPTPAAEIGILPEGRRNDGLHRFGGALRRRGASQQEIEAELLQSNARRCRPPLPDAEVRKIAASAARYPLGGPDPLEIAWQATQDVTYLSKYARVVALARQLQFDRLGQPIALPLVRLGGLMGCDWTQVRRWRKRAECDGLLRLVGRYVPHRKAALYVFDDGPTKADFAKMKPQCPTRTSVPLGSVSVLCPTKPLVGVFSRTLDPSGTLAEEGDKNKGDSYVEGWL